MNDKFNSDRKLAFAFKALFPQAAGEIKIVDSMAETGGKFHYVTSKEKRLKVFHDRIEFWEKIDTKNPVKTLELTKEAIQNLSKRYDEKDSIF